MAFPGWLWLEAGKISSDHARDFHWAMLVGGILREMTSVLSGFWRVLSFSRSFWFCKCFVFLSTKLEVSVSLLLSTKPWEGVGGWRLRRGILAPRKSGGAAETDGPEIGHEDIMQVRVEMFCKGSRKLAIETVVPG